MANRRETAACDGDCDFGGCEEEVEGWEEQEETGKEDGGDHCRDVGAPRRENGKRGNFMSID
jgi:hypothetical protein